MNIARLTVILFKINDPSYYYYYYYYYMMRYEIGRKRSLLQILGDTRKWEINNFV